MTAPGPRKVLHVLNGASGGAALSTTSLMHKLRDLGIESCAVCNASGMEVEYEQLRDATHGEVLFMPLYLWHRKIRSRTWKRPLIELKQLLATGWKAGSTGRVARFARQHGADLIHSNTILTLEGALAARQLGMPHVWHVRELVGPGHPFRLPGEGPRLGNYLARHCDRLVANSQATAAAIESWLPAGLLSVVPNGIDLARFVPRSFDADRSPLVVAMVGSLTSRWKNHELLIRSAALVDRSLPIEWRIYGHDPSQNGQVSGDEYCDGLHAEIRRSGLADRFRFAGYHADPAEIMAEIDILVHPAAGESFGRVIVEAMAAEVPVVGVRAGGVGEIIRDGESGLLADDNQPAQFARQIERLARSADLRRQFGKAGRQRAEESFSLAACAARITDIYRESFQRHDRRQAAPTSQSV